MFLSWFVLLSVLRGTFYGAESFFWGKREIFKKYKIPLAILDSLLYNVREVVILLVINIIHEESEMRK